MRSGENRATLHEVMRIYEHNLDVGDNAYFLRLDPSVAHRDFDLLQRVARRLLRCTNG